MPADSPDKRLRNGTLSDHSFALTLAVPFLLLFLVTQAGTMSPAHDSMCYLRMIERGEFFHEHHLLYNAAAWLWMEFWQLLVPSLGAITLISWLNGLFGALTLSVFALLLVRRAGIGRTPAAVATLLPAFSFGIWFYSITIEVYIIALFFVLAAMYVLTRNQLDARTVIFAAMLHGVAMLFHQLHLFFLFPALYIIMQSRRRENGSAHPAWRLALLYTATAGLTALLPYLFIGWYVLGMNTPERYLHWLIGYGARGDFWNAPGLSLLPKIVLGYGRSLVGADFLFALQPTLEMIERLLPSKWLADQEFVVRRLPEWLAAALVALSVAFTALFVAALGKSLVAARRLRSQLPSVFHSALVFLLTYSMFFTFWDTTNVEFWIPQSVMVWMLLAIVLTLNKSSRSSTPRTKPSAPVLVVLLAGLLFVLNGAGSILWMIPTSNDYYMSKSRDLASLAGDNGLILLPDHYMMDWYLPVESNRRTRTFTRALKDCDRDAACALERLTRSMDSASARGGRIVLDGQLVHPSSAVVIRGGTGYPELMEAFLERFSGNLAVRQAATGPIYVIEGSHSR